MDAAYLDSYAARTEQGWDDHFAEVDVAEPLELAGVPELYYDTAVISHNISRGRGDVRALVVHNEVTALVTSKCYLIIYSNGKQDEDMGSTYLQPMVELPLLRLAPTDEATVLQLSMDGSGTHLLVTVSAKSGVESFHAVLDAGNPRDALLKRPTPVAKLRGERVSAVGWPLSAGLPENERYPTGPVLLGTEKGAFHELQADLKHEAVAKDVHSLGKNVVIKGIKMAPTANGELLVLALTPTSLREFRAPAEGGFGPFFEFVLRSTGAAGPAPVAEMQGPCEASRLLLHTPDTSNRVGTGAAFPPQILAFLTNDGIVHARVLTDSEPPEAEAQTDSGAAPSCICGLERLRFAEAIPDPEELRGQEPLALGVADFHFFVLWPESLRVISRITLKEELVIESHEVEGLEELMRGLTIDADAYDLTGYIFSNNSLHRFDASQGDKTAWCSFMAAGQYERAMELAQDEKQHDAVVLTQANAMFAAGRYREAAALYPQLVTLSDPSFEDLALRFVEREELEALQIYLQGKLAALKQRPNAKAQQLMVATWLLELHLDSINRAVLEAGGSESAGGATAATAALRDFLAANTKVLDEALTTNLLLSYGRVDDLCFFAEQRNDHRHVLQHLLARGATAEALGMLKRPGVPIQHVYETAPALISAAPRETVDDWVSGVHEGLDPEKLLHALLRFGGPHADSRGRLHALRYVEHALGQGCRARALHNLAVSMYGALPDENAMLSYLRTARDGDGAPLYDMTYALRTCLDTGKQRCCICLYSELALYEDAVNTALALDETQQLAKDVILGHVEDQVLQHKLWLRIASFVVNRTGDAEAGEAAAEHIEATIEQAVQVLKDSNGVLSIEDILPFFGDFTAIARFQPAIIGSLQAYSDTIGQLRSDMDEVTLISNALRADLATVAMRSGQVDLEQLCARCALPLGQAPPLTRFRGKALPTGGRLPPYYLFPSKTIFHGTCLCADHLELMDPQHDEKKIQDILHTMSWLAEAGDHSAERVSSKQQALFDSVGAECPRNGEAVINLINKPFVLPDEASSAAAWALC